MPATPIHHTATDDGPWDGPAQEKKLKTPLTTAIGNHAYAWVDSGGDETTKTAWKFIHAFVAADGTPGAASTMACSTGIGILNGARTGTTIPDADRKGVHAHLAAHLVDAGVKESDVPELKSLDVLQEELAASDTVTCPTCDGDGTIMQGNRKCPDCGGSGEVTQDKADEMKSAAASLPATAMRAELRGGPESRMSTGPQFELREVPNGTGGTNLRFTGFASVTNAEYEMEDFLGPWVESVSVGAFGKTLSEGADVAFLLNHTGQTLARTKSGTLKLSEVTEGNKSPVYGITGLHTEADFDPQNMYVQAMRSGVERGDLDEMSFAFRVLRQEWNSDYDRRWINEVSLDKGDVSLVNYGANPTTGGTVTMRQRFTRSHEPMDLRRVLIRLLELRAGATISADTMSKLQSVLDLIDASDTNVDKALIELSALMGVTNPDIAQDAALDRDEPDADDSDGSNTDVAPGPGEPVAHMSHGLFVPDFRADRARLEALRYQPRRSA